MLKQCITLWNTGPYLQGNTDPLERWSFCAKLQELWRMAGTQGPLGLLMHNSMEHWAIFAREHWSFGTLVILRNADGRNSGGWREHRDLWDSWSAGRTFIVHPGAGTGREQINQCCARPMCTVIDGHNLISQRPRSTVFNSLLAVD